MKAISTGVVLICLISLLAISSVELSKTVRFADILYISEGFNSDDSRLGTILDSYAVNSEEVYRVGECRSDIVRAAIDIMLADLDRLNPDNQYDRWVQAAQRSESLLEHATLCSPHNSDYLLRLAMIKRASGETPQELSALVARAVALDPTSIGGLRSRFSLWRRMSAASLSLAQTALDRDLLTLLQFGSPADIRSILKGVSPALREPTSRAFSSLDLQRQDRLNRERVLKE